MKKLTIAFVFLLLTGAAGAVLANPLAPGSYLWYVPEHETYGRTEFYSQASFQSSMVYVTRTQRFRLARASKGWAQIEFDVTGKAYVHLRVLRTLLYDPGASDLWYEFQRASVFVEDPAKIEARLKTPAVTKIPPPTPSAADSKTPAWKRYKDSWGLKPGRPAAVVTTDEATAEGTQSVARPVAGSSQGKPRSKHPLLPPIGSEPPQETVPPDKSERDAETQPR